MDIGFPTLVRQGDTPRPKANHGLGFELGYSHGNGHVFDDDRG